MKKLIEIEEEKHLLYVQGSIELQLNEVEEILEKNKKKIQEDKKYLTENFNDMDSQEILSNKMSISGDIDSYEFSDRRHLQLSKLLENTYFGRINFIYDGEDEEEAIYIGLGGLFSNDQSQVLVYDWRAPISSMYYDNDLGPAEYEAPMGMIKGLIMGKRQYKVRKGILEYVIDTDIRVYDEVLQKELSSNGSVKMRNIVSTIQKEQNQIVRDQNTEIMVVQGVAGSGKTSIALHRIAFLLYQQRKILKSNNILIISPNNIFADYIANVLPELGEENVSEMSFDEMVFYEIGGIANHEPKHDQIEYIINCTDKEDLRMKLIRHKASVEFLNDFKSYIAKLESTLIEFEDFSINEYVCHAEQIRDWYFGKFKRYPIFERVRKIGNLISDQLESDFDLVVSNRKRNKIINMLMGMFSTTKLTDLYEEFLKETSNRYPIFKGDCIDNNRLLYEDVFPVALMKILVEGIETDSFKYIKHVLIDEMQDYTSIQYEIIKSLFNCNMTILGDINQVIDRRDDTVLDSLEFIFKKNVNVIKMMKSFRSTFQISEFCKRICKISDVESFERQGKEPTVEAVENYSEMVTVIEKKISELDFKDINTVAVICKTAIQANRFFDSLDEENARNYYLMNDDNAKFKEGILITNSYLVKGLEFDVVIIPQVTKENYQTEVDRQILYIAGTRALHDLQIYYYNEKSALFDVV